MQFIINNLIYETTRMDKVADVKKWYKVSNFVTQAMYPGKEVGKEYDCELFRSKKGNWLLVHVEDYATNYAQAIQEDEAKELLKRYAYEKYEDMYGALDEA